MIRRDFFKAMFGAAAAGPTLAKQVGQALYGGPTPGRAPLGLVKPLWQEYDTGEAKPQMPEKAHMLDQLKRYKRIFGGNIEYEDYRYIYQNNQHDEDVECLKSCSESGKAAIRFQRHAERARQNMMMDATHYIKKLEQQIAQWWPFG